VFHVKQYDVIVVGGGHAGVEAALAAGRMGAATALVTFRKDDLGVMSCNPAFGGLGKGHLVREIDALDGAMGLAADHAAIQYRLLNRSKGPAVQGPRVQADRARYHAAIGSIVAKAENVTVVEAEATALELTGDTVTGIQVNGNTKLGARAVVLTTGTFLGGKVFIGNESYPAGRMGNAASTVLAEQLRGLDLPMGRLKTGTPPRLRRSSIDWAALDQQPGDDLPEYMSFLTDRTIAPQLSCAITHTNPETHDIVRANLDRSAMYGGQIEGVGPRYCPSIEDKITRFADKQSHQIFLEPEGVDDDIVYPNGISTSLPVDVQTSYVRTIKGLEAAEITQPGYAIEYDYIDPRALTLSLRLSALNGFFLAGQINGTTGYEEAGAQGLIAGLNAARHAMGDNPISLSRSDSYIGVMIDDLTSRGVSEPYRMFTSRAEYRLSLRADNADQRLTSLGMEWGCVGLSRREAFLTKSEALSAARDALGKKSFTPAQLKAAGLKVSDDGARRSALVLLGLPDVDFDTLVKLHPDFKAIEPCVQAQLSKEMVYASYLRRQEAQISALRADEGRSIPTGVEYHSINGLSRELASKLVAAQPKTLAQAARIDGMTPAALVLLLAQVHKHDKRAQA
jgi:tRNA uridine 5-carboxymethylaminomethyl modification enzyme